MTRTVDLQYDFYMNEIEWNKNMEVGLKKIDDQHKCFVEIIRDLNDAIKNQEPKEYLEVIIGEMRDYLRYHFATEEAHMKLYDYENLEMHKDNHKKIMGMVEKIKKEQEDGKNVSEELADFFNNWVKQYMGLEDRALAEFLVRNER